MIIGLIYFSLISVTFTIIISCIHDSIKNKKLKNNKVLVYLFSKCNYIQCCINKKLETKISRLSIESHISEESTGTIGSFKTVKSNTSIYSEDSEINLEKCEKITIKIEKIFILLFLISFIIYCLIIFLFIPKY